AHTEWQKVETRTYEIATQSAIPGIFRSGASACQVSPATHLSNDNVYAARNSRENGIPEAFASGWGRIPHSRSVFVPIGLPVYGAALSSCASGTESEYGTPIPILGIWLPPIGLPVCSTAPAILNAMARAHHPLGIVSS